MSTFIPRNLVNLFLLSWNQMTTKVTITVDADGDDTDGLAEQVGRLAAVTARVARLRIADDHRVVACNATTFFLEFHLNGHEEALHQSEAFQLRTFQMNLLVNWMRLSAMMRLSSLYHVTRGSG
jgi:hypothetical protein